MCLISEYSILNDWLDGIIVNFYTVLILLFHPYVGEIAVGWVHMSTAGGHALIVKKKMVFGKVYNLTGVFKLWLPVNIPNRKNNLLCNYVLQQNLSLLKHGRLLHPLCCCCGIKELQIKYRIYFQQKNQKNCIMPLSFNKSVEGAE